MEFKGKTVEDAITAASVELGVTSDKLNYEVVEEGSSGFLGIFNVKPAGHPGDIKEVSRGENAGVLRRIILRYEGGDCSFHQV